MLALERREACSRAPRRSKARDTVACPDTDSIILAVAAFLFVIALVALAIWAFKTFVMAEGAAASPVSCAGATAASPSWRPRRSTGAASYSRPARRRRAPDHDGGPVDVLIETGIEGRRHLEPPLEDVIIARSDTRPAPDYGKG